MRNTVKGRTAKTMNILARGRVLLAAGVIGMCLCVAATAVRASSGHQSKTRQVAAADKKGAGPGPKYAPYKGTDEERRRGSAIAVVAAYVIVWAVLLVYLFMLHNRQKRLESDMVVLRGMVKVGDKQGAAGPELEGNEAGPS